MFRNLQTKYNVCLLNFIFENSLELSIYKIVVDLFFLVATILQKYLKKKTKTLEKAYIYC